MNTVQGIYKIENTKNKKVYIGQSRNIYRRFEEHQRALENNIHHSVKLQRSYNKTLDKSIFKFSIIEVVNDNKRLDEREQYYIDFYDSFNSGYNCCNVGVLPVNDTSNIKSQKRKYYQDLFSSLLSNGNINVGESRSYKVRNSKGYSWQTIHRLCIVLKWFNDYFDMNRFSLKIGMYGNEFVAYIHDENDELIKRVSFESKNKGYIPAWVFEKVNGNWEDRKSEYVIVDQCVYCT